MVIKTRATSKIVKKVAEKISSAKKHDLQHELPEVAESSEATPTSGMDSDVQMPGADQSITGRGVFAVRTLGTAVSVEAAFLAESGEVMRLPAVFPNREYALEQIDELRALVNRHFDDIAKQG